MGFEFKKVLTNTNSYEAVRWDDILCSTEVIKEYAKKHPFPKTPLYSLEMFIDDVKYANGVIAFPDDTPQEVLDWIVDVIEKLCF